MLLPSDNHLAYFRTFPCVDVQNCTISDTKTAVVPPFWGSKPEPPKIPSADQRGLSRARSMG